MLGFRPISALPIAGQPAAAAGVVTLLPALFTDADTFFAHTLNRGAVTLTASLFTDDDSFFTHTLSQAGGAQTLTASLFTDGDTFYSHTLASPITLTASLYTDADSFFTHTLNRGVVTLLPSLFTDSDSFFTHTLNRGVVTLLPSLFTDGDTFFAHVVVQAGGPVTLLPSLFSDGDTFFPANINAPKIPVFGGFNKRRKDKPKTPPPVAPAQVVVDEAVLRQIEEERLAALVLGQKKAALERVEELRSYAPVEKRPTRTVTIEPRRFDVVETSAEIRSRVISLFRAPEPEVTPPVRGSTSIRLGTRAKPTPAPDIRKTRVVALRRENHRAAEPVVEPRRVAALHALGNPPAPQTRKTNTISLRRAG
jgi:hypothetical protein